MSLDAMGGGVEYSKVEGAYQPGPFTGMGSGTSAGGMSGVVQGGYDYGIASAPILTEPMPAHDVSPGAPMTSPSMQPPQVHIPARPQASRRQSEVSFRAPSAPRDEPYTHSLPFSLVHPGEFVGQTNVSSTTHSIRSLSPSRLPQAKPTAPTSLSLIHVTPQIQTPIPTPEIQHLLQYLPDVQSGNLMIDAFFKEVNWRYGLREKWLSITCSQMWSELQNPSPSHQLNPYWLCLFFSILACSQSLESLPPNARQPSTYDSDTYYLCALTARRIAEDRYFSSSNTTLGLGAPRSSPADGCLFGCLAIPLLCDFLSARGRMSEAWKLMGDGVRVAQSIGLHRDPGSPVWQEMPEEERDLRRRAWWGLYIWDRLLSYILGRPQMIRSDNCDVAKPSSFDTKGRKDSFNLSRIVMIQLADLVSEILDQCMSVTHATWTILAEMDSKFEIWEMSIPAELRPGTTPEQDIILFVGLSPLEIKKFSRHRYMITTWYRLTRLKFYTLIIKRHQQSASTTSRVESPSPIPESVAEKCVRLALELIKYQCDTFDRMRRTKSGENWLGENWYFEGCLSVFEAAVALLLALTKFPTTFFVPPGAAVVEESKVGLKLEYEEMTRVISRVMDVFSEVVVSQKNFDSGSGEVKEGRRAEIASKALDTLQVLLKEHWWKLDPRMEQGRLIRDSPAHLSPRRTGSNPAAGMVGSGPGLPYSGTGYAGGSTMGPVYAPQQPAQLPFRTQSQQISPVQAYSGLVSPSTSETMPSPSSIQQQLQYQVEPNVYGSTAQYPMTTGTYPPSVIPPPPFKNLPVSAGSLSYPQYSPARAPEAPSVASPPGVVQSSPYDYQPQNYFSSIDTPTSYPFPFTPVSNHGSNQSLDQNHSQQQSYQRVPQRPFNPAPYPTQPSPRQSASTSAYAYNSGSSVTTSGSNSASSGVQVPPARTIRSSPGVPPPSQGMKMIHYVAPGSTTTSTTTASGAGIMGSLGAGTMSFSVSGMSQESSLPDPRFQSAQQMQSRSTQSPQESRIVLSEFMGRTTPTGDGGPTGYYR